MDAEPEILSEQILSQNGPFLRIRRWLRGKHPARGVLSKGWTGWETIEDKDVIRPLYKFTVEETPLDKSAEVPYTDSIAQQGVKPCDSCISAKPTPNTSEA